MRGTNAETRDFRLLWVGGLLASMGAQMSILALPLLVLRQSGSPVQAGAIGTVSVGALLVTMLPGGAIADAVERRRLLRWCNVCSLMAVVALAVTVLHGRAPLILVLLVAGASAIITSVSGPAALALLRAVVPAHRLGTAASRMQARAAVARLAGPLAGGALFAWHPAAPFIAEAAGLLLSTICLAFMRTRSRPERQSGSTFSAEHLGAGLTFLLRQPYLRTVLVVFGLGMNAAFSAMMFAALAIASAGGHSGLGGGMVVSLTALGSLAGALLAPRLRPDEHPARLITGTCWTCAVAVAVLAFVHPPVLIGVLAALCMATASLASIGFLTSLLLATPDEKVGRVQSAGGFLSTVVQPVGPLAAGALLGAYGETTTFAVLCAVFALCAVILTWSPGLRRQSRVESSVGRVGRQPEPAVVDE